MKRRLRRAIREHVSNGTTALRRALSYINDPRAWPGLHAGKRARVPSGLGQKIPHRLDEIIRLVMVDPVSGLLHHDDFCVLEMAGPAVLLRIGGPAFFAIDEQGRTGDCRP